jgi:hypothetical protein
MRAKQGLASAWFGFRTRSFGRGGRRIGVRAEEGLGGMLSRVWLDQKEIVLIAVVDGGFDERMIDLDRVSLSVSNAHPVLRCAKHGPVRTIISR